MSRGVGSTRVGRNGRVVRLVALLVLGGAHEAWAQGRRETRPATRQKTTATSFEVTEASVTDVQSAMASGRVTSVQLVELYLARIAAYEHAGPELNALIRLNPNARRDAARLDAERKAGNVRGPLHGVPIIIKDNYDTGDMPTSAGSLALANSQPAQDGVVVKKLRDAGAIVLAKSNLHELAAGITSISSLGGQTRNPYDPTRCPGGSSGGTGAAIAASFATVGWGSDTCGSIRIPSAFGSLFGLRPTIGMVSRSGIVPLSHTQDIGGPLARTMTDLAIALDISVGYDATDSVTRVLQGKPLPQFTAALNKDALRGARIGVLKPLWVDTDAEIADSLRAAIAVMKARGATIIDVPMPEYDTLVANTSVLNMETKFDLANYLSTVPNAPVHSLKEIIDKGLFDKALEARFRSVDTMPSLDSDARKRTLGRQAALRARVQFVIDSLQLDALAYPTMRQKPVMLGAEPQLGSTCQLGAQSGLPSIAMPAGFMAEGLPVSIELLGKAFTDVRLVSLAYAFEQAGARRLPPSTTPALIAGKAPVGVPITIKAISPRATALVQLTYDAPHSTLHWTASTSGVSPDSVRAVVLRRVNAATGGTLYSPINTSRVVARLLGPGMRAGSGTLTLSGLERRALLDGRLTVAVVDDAATAEATVPGRK